MDAHYPCTTVKNENVSISLVIASGGLSTPTWGFWTVPEATKPSEIAENLTKVSNQRSVKMRKVSTYGIAGKFGGDFNLADWRIDSEPPN